MITTTEQQLQLITKRTEKLEAAVSAHVQEVRQLKQQRDECCSAVEEAQRQLEVAQARAHEVTEHYENKMQQLKQAADEYSRAQLLRKKYRNTLDELAGRCKSIAIVENADSVRDTLVVADECTINFMPHQKQFVFDLVALEGDGGESAGDGHASGPWTASMLQSLATDLLGGTSCAVITFGPSGGGKSALVFGPLETHSHPKNVPSRFHSKPGSRSVSSSVYGTSQFHEGSTSAGLVPSFLRELFSSFERHEVSHFYLRSSFVELTSDGIVDLLSDFANISPVISAHDVRLLPFQNLEEGNTLLFTGLRRSTQRGAAAHRSPSHRLFTVVAENFNLRGHFRRASITFCDLCGASSTAMMLDPEQQWINKSLSSFCDCVAFLSTVPSGEVVDRGSHPSLQSRLVNLLGESLGGNCKTTMLCVLNGARHTPDEMLSALTYAYHFKAIQNHPIPYNIPAELQKLQLEASEFEVQ